jgi:hypothetical protein
MWTLNWTRIGATEGGNVRDQQSADAYSYVLIPQKWENPNKCRNALGLVGGSEVSHASGNLIDVESELMGITRANSKCNSKQYVPSCPLGGDKCPDTLGNIVFKEKTTGEARETLTQLPNVVISRYTCAAPIWSGDVRNQPFLGALPVHVLISNQILFRNC